MNPANGLRIRAFRQAHINRKTDRELLKLGKYLKEIATLEDFCMLNHRNWEKFMKKKQKEKKKKRKPTESGSPTDSDQGETGGSMESTGTREDGDLNT